jgi:phosphatidylethanolamine N-methyltransferase
VIPLIAPREIADEDLHRFGVEFAPEVVQADGNVRNLAWRICNAKKVLVSLLPTLFAGPQRSEFAANRNPIQAPYSMSASKGRTTPTLG